MIDNKKLTGAEHFDQFPDELALSSAHDFWQWAFSDLKMNDTRGVFAEWMVAKLLDLPMSVRVSWAEYDLQTTDGVTLEVKSSAYLQSWKQNGNSAILFTGLKGKKLDPATNRYATDATYNADLYVFCVQTETDHNHWNAFDLSQWDFYTLSKAQLERLDQRSLSLKRLSALCTRMTAGEFRIRTQAVIAAIRNTT